MGLRRSCRPSAPPRRPILEIVCRHAITGRRQGARDNDFPCGALCVGLGIGGWSTRPVDRRTVTISLPVVGFTAGEMLESDSSREAAAYGLCQPFDILQHLRHVRHSRVIRIMCKAMTGGNRFRAGPTARRGIRFGDFDSLIENVFKSAMGCTNPLVMHRIAHSQRTQLNSRELLNRLAADFPHPDKAAGPHIGACVEAARIITPHTDAAPKAPAPRTPYIGFTFRCSSDPY